MCGRYVSPEEAAMEREWKLSRHYNPFTRTNWNVAPTHIVPALRRAADDPQNEQPERIALRWGLIPDWAKGVPPKYGTIMATCERLATAPTWRGPWKRGQRCILLAHGFYEWQPVTDAAGRTSKQPWYIQIGDQPVFGMAGLWDASTGADGATVESCAVITIPANAVMNVIDGTADTNDGRMPAILTREDWHAWLTGTKEEAFKCLKPYSDELTIARKVGKGVNSPKNNDAGLVEESVS